MKTTEQKDVNIRIGRKAYRRLKMRAAKHGMTLKDTVDILSML